MGPRPALERRRARGLTLFARRRVARPPRAIDFWPFGGMIAMVSALFLYGASGLVAPWWAVVLLLLLWLALFVLCCSWWSTHPRRITVVALGAVAVWFGVLVAGGAWWGWTA